MSGARAIGKIYRLVGLRFEHEPRGRWGVSNGSLGVGGRRTPIGAWLALRRLVRSGYQGRPQ